MARRVLATVRVTTLAAAAVVLAGCTSGSDSAPTPSARESSSASSASAGGSTSSAPSAATVTTAPGDSVPSIPGAPTRDALLTQAQALVPGATAGEPIAFGDGTTGQSVLGLGDDGESFGFQIYTAASGNLVQLDCGSNAPAASPDAIRDVCLDIAAEGAGRRAATAWVASSLAALPPGADVNSAGLSNLDLAGLEWKVYRGTVPPGGTDTGYLWVEVAAKGFPLKGVTGS